MGKVEVKINPAGILELFKSPGIKATCESAAESIKNNAGGDGYNVSSYTGPNRAGAAVWVNSREAMEDNYENNTLLKATGMVIPAGKIVRKG